MRTGGWTSLITTGAALAGLLLLSGPLAGCGKGGKKGEASPSGDQAQQAGPAQASPAPAGSAPAGGTPTPPVRSESFRISDYSATITPAPAAVDAGAPARPAGGK